jgi:type III restriction enzyme
LVEDFVETNQITARTVLKREIDRRFPPASKVIDLTDKKFNALIGFGSRAYKHLTEKTNEIINVYLEEAELKQSENETFPISPISLYDKKYRFFKNSIHEKYSGLNELEEEFVDELDKFNFPWCRNPSRSGYGIPLLTEGSSKTFYPDFLVWKEDKVIAIDTTGEHLLKDKLSRKLLFISPAFNAKQKLVICFVSQGEYNQDLSKRAKDGWTLWGLKENRELSVKHRDNLSELIKFVLES